MSKITSAIALFLFFFAAVAVPNDHGKALTQFLGKKRQQLQERQNVLVLQRQAKLERLDFLMNLSQHDVTEDFSQEIRDLGFDLMELTETIESNYRNYIAVLEKHVLTRKHKDK